MSRDGTLPPGIKHWDIEEAQDQDNRCETCGTWFHSPVLRDLCDPCKSKAIDDLEWKHYGQEQP